jgi:hypothetical protein
MRPKIGDKTMKDKFLTAIKKAAISNKSKISIFPVFSKPVNGSNYGKPRIFTDPEKAYIYFQTIQAEGIEIRVDGVRINNWI